MNKSRRTLCRHVGLALCLLMIFTVLPVPVAASETKTDTESKTVRVGWYPDSYHITGENGERSGYGYEYEQAVAAYTGWNYEYIKGDWGELVEKLQNGEIDLMVLSRCCSQICRWEKKYIICLQILQIRIFLRQIFLP